MILRDYQAKAIEAAYRHLERRDTNPLVVIPMGGGKTPCIARICRDAVEWGGRAMVLSHVRELLAQSRDHILRLDPDLDVGVYSAGMGEKNPNRRVTVAGIQSAWRAPEAFEPPDVILADEAHRIPAEGEGMWLSFLSAMRERNPDVRIVGFTATPYRLDSGPIYGPKHKHIFGDICFEVGIRELVKGGWLAPAVSRGPAEETDFSGLKVSGGDFAAGEADAFMSESRRVGLAVADLACLAADRKAVIAYCCGVRHAGLVAAAAEAMGLGPVAEVYGSTPAEERDAAVEAFRAGWVRTLVNCEVFTLGFDAPNIDCVAMLRPTLSAGLYVQMAGRGLRLHPGKENCLVLDFGGNVLRHGPVDAVRIRTKAGGKAKKEGARARKCPLCLAYSPAKADRCVACGAELPSREVSHGTKAWRGDVVSNDVFEVAEVRYAVHRKSGDPDATPVLRVTYENPFRTVVKEFVCLEHTGYARQKAEAWWRRRAKDGGGNVPMTVREAIDAAARGAIIEPESMIVDFNGKYPVIQGVKFPRRRKGTDDSGDISSAGSGVRRSALR